MDYNLINKVFNYLNEGNELTNNYLNNLQKELITLPINELTNFKTLIEKDYESLNKVIKSNLQPVEDKIFYIKNKLKKSFFRRKKLKQQLNELEQKLKLINKELSPVFKKKHNNIQLYEIIQIAEVNYL